jgi:SsrA-binding protein
MVKGAAKQVPEAWRDKPKPKAPAEPVEKTVATNRRARHDYLIEDKLEAGIVLSGTEVKALREGKASLQDGWVTVEAGEAWLEGVYIQEYVNGTWTNHAPRRRRKLLLHKSEILKLGSKSQEKGHTVVPLRLYFLGGRAKVEIALARGKKDYDKRHALREAQDDREAQRAMRSRERLGD